jgi:hypothetical protein
VEISLPCRGQDRAVDKHGQTMDFLLTEQRDERKATRFLTKAIRRHGVPETITINGSEANAAAIKRYNEEHRTAIVIRQVKYLNNIVEQDHRGVKRITRPEVGLKSFAAVQDTMVGIELMCIIEQRQMVVEKGGKVSLQLNSSTPWLPNHLRVRVTSSQITYARKFETKPLRPTLSRCCQRHHRCSSPADHVTLR